MKKSIIFCICYVVLLVVIYYLALPAINLAYFPFYIFIAIVLAGIAGMILASFRTKFIQKHDKTKKMKKWTLDKMTGKLYSKQITVEEKYSSTSLFVKGFSLTVGSVLVLCIIFSITGAKLFRAEAYYKQLNIVTEPAENLNTDFDIEGVDVKLPIIDKELAFKLAQAKLGDYGAQYQINYENFTIISVHRNGVDELVRIAPLEYSNWMVSLNRKNQGTIGYIEVNVVTKEAKLIEVEGGLKYMPSAKLDKDLTRHIRFNYLTKMFGERYFEIDDEGNPYWVVPTYKNKVSVFSGPDNVGVIIVNPVTGDSQYYNRGDEPEWVDRVVVDSLVEEQATNAFKYKNGFFNATFGQKKEVFQVSDGYNYFIKDGHTYYVSCITSPNENDQTSIGFVAVDLKTKEAVRYTTPGITEMRARDIAMMDERVKAQALDATWPILITYQNTPTYFLVLKNDVQAQKIVLVNVSDGTLVAMGNTLKEAQEEYNRLLANSDDSDIEEKTVDGVVTHIRDLGETIEFMISTNQTKYFVVNPNISVDARFMKIGDEISIIYKEYGTYNYVVNYIKK